MKLLSTLCWRIANCWPQSNVKPSPRARRFLQAFERLEDRLAPVVGSLSNAAPVPPGDFANAWVGTVNYDGVVSVMGPSGAGTGALLSTGRHILTAAHVVDDPGSYTVRFDLPGKTVTYSVSGSSIIVHPSWNGNSDDGFDFAIIRLPELAPAKGYDLYTGSAELGQIVTLVGYGRNGTGATGQGPPGSGGTKRVGWNHFSSVDGNLLVADFDNGTSGANEHGDDDWLGHAFEAAPARGDSGGPAFIGTKIAGVTSFGTDTSGDGLFSTWGDTNTWGRVSTVSNWINNTTYGSHDLVLNMTNQLEGDDGLPDHIELRRNGSVAELWVNNIRRYSYYAGFLSSVTLIGSGDADSVTIDTGFDFPITVVGGSGQNTLASAEHIVNNWGITGPGAGVLNSTASFFDFQTLKGHNSGDVFYVFNGGSIATIDGRGGNDILTYGNYAGPVSVNLQSRSASGVGTFERLETFAGSGSLADTLIGPGGLVNRWFITGYNSGTLANYSAQFTWSWFTFFSFENLQGSAAADAFLFSNAMAINGRIDGKAGFDTLDYSAYTTPVTVNLANSTATGTGGFHNIENLIGGQASDTLVLPPYSINWQNNGDGSQTIRWNHKVYFPITNSYLWVPRQLTFRGMEKLKYSIYPPKVALEEPDNQPPAEEDSNRSGKEGKSGSDTENGNGRTAVVASSLAE